MGKRVKRKLGDLKPSIYLPPIHREDFIAELVESFRKDPDWDSGIKIARYKGKDGYEECIVAGHSRVEALKRLYSPEHTIEVEMASVTSEQAIRFGINENAIRKVLDNAELQSVIKQVLIAFSKGEITLPPPSPKTRKEILRYAPNIEMGGDGDLKLAWTPATLAKWLGWPKTRVRTVLDNWAKDISQSGSPSVLATKARKPKTKKETAPAISEDIDLDLEEDSIPDLEGDGNSDEDTYYPGENALEKLLKRWEGLTREYVEKNIEGEDYEYFRSDVIKLTKVVKKIRTIVEELGRTNEKIDDED